MPELCLIFPSGRIDRLSVPMPVKSGQEFQLHGHRWKVIGPEVTARGSLGKAETGALLCRQIAATR